MRDGFAGQIWVRYLPLLRCKGFVPIWHAPETKKHAVHDRHAILFAVFAAAGWRFAQVVRAIKEGYFSACPRIQFHDSEMPIGAAGPQEEEHFMAKDTGQNYRKGSVTNRTQGKNPKTSDYTKRNETPRSPAKGKYMDVKSRGQKFKGVAQELDRRRGRAMGDALAGQ